jgi:hypothetical protein
MIEDGTMGCTQVYDFIRGTKTSLPQLHRNSHDRAAPFDIFHPGREAADLVDSQVRALNLTRDGRRKWQIKKAPPDLC